MRVAASEKTGDGFVFLNFNVGVSRNVIEASWQALCDSLDYKLYKNDKRERLAQRAKA